MGLMYNLYPFQTLPTQLLTPEAEKEAGRGRVSQQMCKINYWTVVISRQGRPETSLMICEVLCFSS